MNYLIKLIFLASLLMLYGCAKKDEPKPISKVIAVDKKGAHVVISPTLSSVTQEGKHVWVRRSGTKIAEAIVKTVDKSATIIEIIPGSGELPLPGDQVFAH